MPLAAGADPQEEIVGVPHTDLKPVLVCPPRYSVPMVIPAEEMLRQAEQLTPVSPEGWILHHRPVADCENCVGSAEDRAYELFEYPLKIRDYNTRVRLLEAQVASWERRLKNYEYFNKAGALFLAVENAQLAHQAASERLRNLRYERMLFLRLHNLERQLHQGIEQPTVASH
jgi:hypothetical protein